MPQLEIEWFPTQIFWLAVSFLTLYFVLSRVALPKIKAVLDARESQIDSDLAAAGRARQKAADLAAAKAEQLGRAHGEAQQLIKTALDQVAALKARGEADLAQELAATIKAAETRIMAAKNAALSQIAHTSADITQAAILRLGGETPSPEILQAAIDQAARERAPARPI